MSGSPMGRLLRPIRGTTIVAGVLAGLGSLCGLVPFLAIAELARRLLNGPVEAADVRVIVLIVLAGLGGRALLTGAALVITHLADVRLQADITRRVVAHLGKLPLAWFTTTPSGELRKRVQNDVHDLHYLVAHARMETVAAVVLPVGGVGYLVVLDWRLALLAVATIPAYGVAMAVMMRGYTENMRRVNAAMSAVSSALVELVSGIAVLKTFGRGRRAHQAYQRAAEEFGQTYAQWVGPMLRLESLATIAIAPPMVLLVSLAGGIWFVGAGWVDPVAALTAVMIAVIVPSVLTTVGFGMQARRDAATAAERIVTLLDTPPLPEPAHPTVPDGRDVTYENVRFSYDGDHDVLHGIDLHCPAGTLTAIVGPSGAGKTTLVELLPRFGDATGGTVRLGGTDVRRIPTEQLYQQVGFVLQDVALLAGSVRDNIRLGRPETTDEQVHTAAHAARIHERILDLPRGYDSVIEQDARLSGGERQRVAIARALLADTPVLVLDEATTAVDPEAEADIQQALSRLAAGRTVLVIAHRLRTIVEADQIVVVDQGRVAATGTHADLLAENGPYAQLWRRQDDDDTSLLAADSATSAAASAGGTPNLHQEKP